MLPFSLMSLNKYVGSEVNDAGYRGKTGGAGSHRDSTGGPQVVQSPSRFSGPMESRAHTQYHQLVKSRGDALLCLYCDLSVSRFPGNRYEGLCRG